MKLLSKQKLLSLLSMLVVSLIPLLAICQPAGAGGSPDDEPLDNPVVPIDGKLTLLFLAAAIVFAVVMFRKLQQRRGALKH